MSETPLEDFPPFHCEFPQRPLTSPLELLDCAGESFHCRKSKREKVDIFVGIDARSSLEGAFGFPEMTIPLPSFSPSSPSTVLHVMVFLRGLPAPLGILQEASLAVTGIKWGEFGMTLGSQAPSKDPHEFFHQITTNSDLRNVHLLINCLSDVSEKTIRQGITGALKDLQKKFPQSLRAYREQKREHLYNEVIPQIADSVSRIVRRSKNEGESPKQLNAEFKASVLAKLQLEDTEGMEDYISLLMRQVILSKGQKVETEEPIPEESEQTHPQKKQKRSTKEEE